MKSDGNPRSRCLLAGSYFGFAGWADWVDFDLVGWVDFGHFDSSFAAVLGWGLVN
jgi:hypothetical protein